MEKLYFCEKIKCKKDNMLKNNFSSLSEKIYFYFQKAFLCRRKRIFIFRRYFSVRENAFLFLESISLSEKTHFQFQEAFLCRRKRFTTGQLYFNHYKPIKNNHYESEN